MPVSATLTRLAEVESKFDTIYDLPPSEDRENQLGMVIVERDQVLAEAIRTYGSAALLDVNLQPKIRSHVSNSLYAQTLSLALSGQELPDPLDAVSAIEEVFERKPETIDAIAFA